jgi:hypothetical protein
LEFPISLRTPPVLKDEVPLAFAGMDDFDFDEHRVGERPGFAWFGF